MFGALWEGVKNVASKAGNWLGGSTPASSVPNWLGVIGTAGKIYADVQSQKAAKKNLELQKQAFDFNKMLSQREINRANKANNNLANAWAQSTAGTPNINTLKLDDELERWG